eukprot:454003-Pleurochrysis_carterae.AAC.2
MAAARQRGSDDATTEATASQPCSAPACATASQQIPLLPTAATIARRYVPSTMPYHQLWETLVRCTATAVALRVAARQRCACFEASYQRQNELTKQHTKQTAANDLHAENEPRELSSLETNMM